VSVADVPGGGRSRDGADALADLLADLLLCVDLGGVFCHHGGEQLFVGHLGGFVHAVILQGQRVQLGVLRDRLGGGTR